ncbi:MAG: LysR substrate-binding domain-containing protein [Nocardioides sp.]
MELRQLRYFVAVAEERHFGRAAARLHIATPSLSQQVKALERDLGLRLFERTPAGATPTAAAEELLPLVRRALDSAAEVTSASLRIAQDRTTVLRLGFLAFTLTPVSRDLLTAFGREAPEVTVELRQYEWDDPSAGLLTGQTDAGLVRPPFTGTDRLRLLTLAREAVLAVVPEGHPLAGEGGVTLARIAEEPFLEVDVVTDPVFAAAWYLRGLRGDGARRVTSRAGTVEEWLAEVSFGRGVNLVPAGLAVQYERPGLAFVPVTDAPPSRLALAWRRDDETPAVRALARLVARRRARRDPRHG